VANTGIGLPAGEIAGLFAPFSQIDTSTLLRRQRHWTGLVISKRLCALMSGKISVESRLY